MLPLTVSLSPDTTSGPAKTPATTPALPVAAFTNATQAARPQLASAVVAASPLAAFATQTPQPPKPTLRVANGQISSALAAQYIAQTPELTDEDLELFATRDRAQPDITDEENNSPEDDFLTRLRIARGDTIAPAAKPTANERAAAAQNNEPPAPPVVNTAATANNAIRAGISPTNGLPQTLSLQFLAKLPPAQLSKGGKKPGLNQARGSTAYQLTDSRNANKTPTVSAVL